MNWTTRKARHPDNTGGFDYAICSDDGMIVGEVFEHVGRDANGNIVKAPAAQRARLMAAAPDLLAALEEVVRISDRKHDAWDAARAAMAKARGDA